MSETVKDVAEACAAELVAALTRPSILASTAFADVLRRVREELGLERGEDVVSSVARLKARLSEIEKPGHVVLPVEEVQRLLSRASFAADQLSAVAGDIEDGAPFRELRGKYVMALVDARDDLREALTPLRKHLEGQSR
jgi:hypothetical protein